jgi:predicted dehydrogenase
MIRIVVLGCGRIGGKHVASVERHSGAFHAMEPVARSVGVSLNV